MQAKRRTSAGAGASLKRTTITETDPTRTPSPESIAWKGAVMQTAREGRAVDLIALLADLEDSGDITREPEETDVDPADLENTDAVDAEIDLSDEDDARLEGWDDLPGDMADTPFAPGKAIVQEDDTAELPMRIELLVADGYCRAHWPTWMRAEPLTEHGQEFLDEIGHRFDVLNAVGDWLSRKRKAFLHKPDPWLLGVEALDEMRKGFASVAPGSFLVLSGLDKIEPPYQFSRHTTDCLLVWEDGTLPLDFIFGREARTAWVANAVAQLAVSLKVPMSDGLLDRHHHITVPKSSKAKRQLMEKEMRALEFGDSIARANLMAGTKWVDVLTACRSRILKSTS